MITPDSFLGSYNRLFTGNY